MRTKAHLVRAAAAAAVLALLSAGLGSGAVQAAAAATTSWEVFQLTPLQPGDITTVFDINENGGSAGQSDDQPVVWTRDGEPLALPVPQGYDGGVAFSLNDQSQAVGLVYNDVEERGIVWSAGTTTLLGASDFVVSITPGGVMVGADFSELDAGGACCISGFVQAVGGPRFTLPPSSGADVLPAAATDSGIVVGLLFGPSFAVGAGWYQQYAFPIGGITDATFLNPVDVIAAPAVLASRSDGAGASSVIVTNTGEVVPLAHPSPIDLAADMNRYGVAVGAGGTSFEGGPEVGRLYAYGAAVSLDSLVAPADHDYDLHDPIALNDAFWIVGNAADGSSWLIRPASGAAASQRAASIAPREPAPDRPLPPHRGDLPLPVDRPLAWSTAPAR